MEKSKKIIVYTDGGSRGNPGPAALGVVIKDEKGNLKKIKALFGKEKTKKMVVDMRMDSELVAKQLTGKYKIEVERLFPLFIKIWNLKMDFKNISYTHVPREQNKEADQMVNEALDFPESRKLF